MKNFIDTCHDIEKQKFSIQKNCFPIEFVYSLISRLQAHEQAGRFKAAGIGKQQKVVNAIRGDEIVWLEKDNPIENEYLKYMNELSFALNSYLFLGLKQVECHFARYPKQTYYQKHYDNFKNFEYRIITVILYLNFDWQKCDGGTLFIYDENNKVIQEILPEANTFVCFISKNTAHEVTMTYRERLSVTGWLRTDNNIL